MAWRGSTPPKKKKKKKKKAPTFKKGSEGSWQDPLLSSQTKGMSMEDQYNAAQDWANLQNAERAKHIGRGYDEMLRHSERRFAGADAAIQERGVHMQGSAQQKMMTAGLAGSTAGLASQGLASRETAFARNNLTKHREDARQGVDMRRLKFLEDIEQQGPNLQNMALLAQMSGQYGGGGGGQKRHPYGWEQVPSSQPGHLRRWNGKSWEYGRQDIKVGKSGFGGMGGMQLDNKALTKLPVILMQGQNWRSG
jgi:hypothetical protein